mmetsp:Transcript_30487/g.74264  ORF Transcript_30487/g.74264 Transcript_30487/m.74264 type:complete len:624 (+) Transcript_30487:233-2104(+)|eukprot:CAMPEP_0114494112 /NCGR_PEP_ID=MMETSP0109-20121206/4475_1 /TAXON_ID=29199 /ORGANISM="Chlorarachnion reptans, Strain CCCM449" /LENGTH=623 /DNA_ID=CAMNT_0001671121 /DNA_START=185 /DNA_END=2056 /DNA_ORIENTATION=-
MASGCEVAADPGGRNAGAGLCVDTKSAKSGGEYVMVWLRKDVRFLDNEALSEAVRDAKRVGAKVLLAYFYEEDIVQRPDFASCHLKFVNEGLREFSAKAESLGGYLITKKGTLPNLFEQLLTTNSEGEDTVFRLKAIYTHEETGNSAMRLRNERVATWSKKAGVQVKYFNQTGVTKNLTTRDGWAKKWRQLMDRPSSKPPETLRGLCINADSAGLLWEEELGVFRDRKPEAACGGESLALELLKTFTEGKRSVGYGKNVSSPNTAWEGCSRLSPYLTWGHISLRTVYKTVKRLRERLKQDKALKASAQSSWARDLSSFEARLRWRSHFMQKLEDEPSMETENLCRAYDGMRDRHFMDGDGAIGKKENETASNADMQNRRASQQKFAAWCTGNTGFPMVDAVMRCLLLGGWINFRMRAMLVSFASYTLWLDWRETSKFLGKHFLDYEPGIHYPQFQMQSGTTGINALRIYNPTKQVTDHDKEGTFIRRYVPALSEVPKRYIAEPWKMPEAVQKKSGCIIGEEYPPPIVDQSAAYTFARKRIGDIRKQEKSKEESKRVYVKHGSRKRPSDRRSVRKTKASPAESISQVDSNAESSHGKSESGNHGSRVNSRTKKKRKKLSRFPGA